MSGIARGGKIGRKKGTNLRIGAKEQEGDLVAGAKRKLRKEKGGEKIAEVFTRTGGSSSRVDAEGFNKKSGHDSHEIFGRSVHEPGHVKGKVDSRESRP